MISHQSTLLRSRVIDLGSKSEMVCGCPPVHVQNIVALRDIAWDSGIPWIGCARHCISFQHGLTSLVSHPSVIVVLLSLSPWTYCGQYHVLYLTSSFSSETQTEALVQVGP
jgi:hypothetical protein